MPPIAFQYPLCSLFSAAFTALEFLVYLLQFLATLCWVVRGVIDVGVSKAIVGGEVWFTKGAVLLVKPLKG